jgi:saccharopine dehydrogenase (NAD+, L-lysine-forming)
MMVQAGQIVVAGGGGAQGLECISYLRSAEPNVEIIAVDRGFSPAALNRLRELGATSSQLDLLAEPDRLHDTLLGASIVVNLAGPFFALGTTVLDAAIKARTPYLDICDDVDATAQLLARNASAVDAGVPAIIGMGSAPGTTNLLVKLALGYLGAENGEGRADISWCAPGGTLTFGIFQHLVHCYRTALPARERVPDWDELEPRIVEFPDPIGELEVVRLGHPEPLTLERHLGCETTLRGGMTGDGLQYFCWELARACDDGLSIHEAWSRLCVALPQSSPDAPEYSGMAIDVWRGKQGVRFESATTISMEQSTAVPAATVALMMRDGENPAPGVWPPEVLDPASFFSAASRVSPGGGGLSCVSLSEKGERGERIPLRTMFANKVAS